MFSRLDEFVQKLFVDICFSIAQYMEDFFQYTKNNLLYSVKKQNKETKKHFTDILECSINKKLL